MKSSSSDGFSPNTHRHAELRYDVVLALTFYHPYVSGLSEAARLIGEGLAGMGRQVAVATTRFDKSLPKNEKINGVEVYRARVGGRVSKGVISPGFVPLVRRLSRQSRLLNLHLPLMEAGILSMISACPVVVTYQCDVNLGSSLLDKAIVSLVDWSSRAAIRNAEATVFSSNDYLMASRNASVDFKRIEIIRPPYIDRAGGRPTLRETDGLHAGFLGRIVAEKGLDVLLDAFAVLDAPDARLLIGGEFESVAGGSIMESLRNRIERDERVRVLGFIPDAELLDFYASLDVLVLPSTNSLEAYGIVQLEAMSAGVPVIASDRPGVRVPVREFGLGQLIAPGDVQMLTEALFSISTQVLGVRSEAPLALRTATDPVTAYARLFERVSRDTGPSDPADPR